MRIWDISPLLSEKIAVWPGDTPLTREVLSNIAEGGNIDLSTIRATVHLGAHVDAPRHYHRSGIPVDEVDLSKYIGPCYVHSVLNKSLITKEDCAAAIRSGRKRVLFRTGTFPDPASFNKNFAAFAPDSIAMLGEAGFVLVGIDTPSVDPFDSKDLPAHQQLYIHKMANLEGIVLDHVSDGTYELVALPLKLKGFDASPVRAILREES